MSWRAQNRSKDAKTPSVAGFWSQKPELGPCPIQPYVRNGSVGSVEKIADSPRVVKFLGGERCKPKPNIGVIQVVLQRAPVGDESNIPKYRGTQLAARGPSGNRRPSAKIYTRRYTENRTGAITPHGRRFLNGARRPIGCCGLKRAKCLSASPHHGGGGNKGTKRRTWAVNPWDSHFF